MSLSGRITRVPRPHDPDRAGEIRALFSDLAPELVALLSGAGGCSPYLKGVMEREAEWLREALGQSPEAAFDALLGHLGTVDDGELRVALRVAKRRVALLTGLADLGGAWRLEEVTGSLTRFADLAVHRAALAEIGVELRRGRLPGQGESDLGTAGGFVALAMGKMGAYELNYSSDIDLICLFDTARYEGDTYMDARTAFVRATRRISALLSESTPEGYVFRTDLRLRPDPSVTPVCMSMDAAERYYESLGRTWERAAHIKARPAAGDIGAGIRYLERLRPFVWRKHLDYAAIEDAHAMRLRIRDHKKLGGRINLRGHDMKLGRGGIREIEFFTQTRQIIAGGRDASLRLRGTVEGLQALAAAGWIGEDVAEQLAQDYRAHREIEHRVQMVADMQTHALPDDPDGFARIAAMMDRDPEALAAELRERLNRVSELTEDFFKPDAPAASGVELDAAQEEIVQRWRSYPALRSERALDIFDRIRPALLEQLLSGPRPEQALAHFDGFLRGLPAGVQLFSLFEANPQLLGLIADIAGTTPDLAQYLSRNSGVLDAVLGGSFFEAWPGGAALTDALARRLAAQRDYERQLDETRAWARDWHFRIGVHHLRGLVSAAEAGSHYADLAGAVVAALWPAVIAEFAAKHGAPPGRGAIVLAMGSLGAGRLNARSDLDLIVIYDAGGVEASEGRRPLAARTYYARLTQALVTALSAPTAEGRLYEVDMRLRPSGKQGPVATALSSFEHYQMNEAWTWEHLALTRARPIAGPPELAAAVSGVRDAVLALPRDPDKVRGDVAAMRARLQKARSGGAWDAKSGAGHLQDIELCATALGLLSGSDARDVDGQIAAGWEAGLIGAEDAAELTAIHRVLARFRTALRLIVADEVAEADIGAAGEALLLRDTGASDLTSMRQSLAERAERAAEIVTRVLGDGSEGDSDGG